MPCLPGARSAWFVCMTFSILWLWPWTKSYGCTGLQLDWGHLKCTTHPVAGVSKLCEHLRQVDEAVKVGAPEAEGTAHLGFVRRVPRQPHEGEPRLPACMHARSLET